jgi:hypothetical protein
MRDEVDASSMNKLKSMTRGKKKGDKMRVQLNQSQTKKYISLNLEHNRLGIGTRESLPM